jgi:hypothetical protein
VRDDTVLTSVRGISDLSELYYEFSEYRLEMLEARVRTQLKELRDKRRVGKKIETKRLKEFLAEQEMFLARTNHEIVPEEEVPVGHIDEIDIPDVKVGDTNAAPPSKRARVA